ncbi:GNAT family N-acetyltransferase [Helicobacter cappadocius]|uniref:GNAT family N-acetyltransferase n=1 Tax=Helicobacter cappadocius TaxID=3063998 RepID=A0AA90PLJ2_9HELI|nr:MULTISPECIES: GNAT family N-acetyltransferase [unclassified Helicobacter]MDO7253687.1 GNAT family N-acetyltransferase [Helicobacter sp. faydin-H75]MDP2539625.1 GNAT family N-acetyltransferase [Helicobacter sp. faydin-H76]
MIRSAKQDDLKKLYRLEESLFTLKEGRFTPSIFRYHFKLKNRIFVLCEGEEIAGYLLVIMYAKSARIYSLAVDSKHQGKGYGKKLCEYAINLALKASKKSISLEVRSSNQKAISLYLLLGFSTQKVLSSYYGDEDGIKMKKQLMK